MYFALYIYLLFFRLSAGVVNTVNVFAMDYCCLLLWLNRENVNSLYLFCFFLHFFIVS